MAGSRTPSEPPTAAPHDFLTLTQIVGTHLYNLLPGLWATRSQEQEATEEFESLSPTPMFNTLSLGLMTGTSSLEQQQPRSLTPSGPWSSPTTSADAVSRTPHMYSSGESMTPALPNKSASSGLPSTRTSSLTSLERYVYLELPSMFGTQTYVKAALCGTLHDCPGVVPERTRSITEFISPEETMN